MILFRLALREKLLPYILEKTVLLINTVHDSIVLDVDTKRLPKHEWHKITQLIYASLEEVVPRAKQQYGINFKVPFEGEVTVGVNQAWEHAIKKAA